MKKLIVCLVVSVSLFAQHRQESSITLDAKTSQTLVCPYLVLPMPGVGCSYRWDGNAVDASVGFLGVGCTYSKIFYTHKEKDLCRGFYGSVGVGGGIAYVPMDFFRGAGWKVSPEVIVPLRFGYERNRGFWDAGVSVMYAPGFELFLPIPEFRGGFQF